MGNEDGKRAAVYIPFATLLTALDVLGEGLPPKLDTSVWSNFAGGVRTHVWSAFKFLRLIDSDGVPTKSLEQLVSKDNDRNAVLKGVLEAAYAEVVNLAEQNASQKALEDAMRDYGISGQETIAKAVRFYMQAADQLALPVSSFWRKAKAVSSSTSGSRRRSTKRTAKTPPAEPPAGQDNPPPDDENLHEISLADMVKVTLNVTGPLTKLPREDRDFVFELVDAMTEYEAKQRQPKATVGGRNVPVVVEEQPKLADGAVN